MYTLSIWRLPNYQLCWWFVIRTGNCSDLLFFQHTTSLYCLDSILFYIHEITQYTFNQLKASGIKKFRVTIDIWHSLKLPMYKSVKRLEELIINLFIFVTTSFWFPRILHQSKSYEESVNVRGTKHTQFFRWRHSNRQWLIPINHLSERNLYGTSGYRLFFTRYHNLISFFSVTVFLKLICKI